MRIELIHGTWRALSAFIHPKKYIYICSNNHVSGTVLGTGTADKTENCLPLGSLHPVRETDDKQETWKTEHVEGVINARERS